MYGYKEKCHCEVDFKGHGRFALPKFSHWLINVIFVNVLIVWWLEAIYSELKCIEFS